MRFIVLVLLTTFGLANGSLACRTHSGVNFDEMPSEKTVVGIADVTSIVWSRPDDRPYCVAVTYSVTETIFGKFPDLVTVKICEGDYDPVWDNPIPLEEVTLQHDGIAAGASALVGLIREEDTGEVKYRYADPYCYGWMLVRLDSLSKRDRTMMMDIWLTDIKANKEH